MFSLSFTFFALAKCLCKYPRFIRRAFFALFSMCQLHFFFLFVFLFNSVAKVVRLLGRRFRISSHSTFFNDSFYRFTSRQFVIRARGHANLPRESRSLLRRPLSILERVRRTRVINSMQTTLTWPLNSVRLHGVRLIRRNLMTFYLFRQDRVFPLRVFRGNSFSRNYFIGFASSYQSYYFTNRAKHTSTTFTYGSFVALRAKLTRSSQLSSAIRRSQIDWFPRDQVVGNFS